MRLIALHATLALTLVCGACTSVETTNPGAIGLDRKQYMSPLVPAGQLEEGARAAYAQVLGKEKQKGTLNRDAKQLARIRRIAQRIIPQVSVFRPDARRWDWQVNLIESDQLNAWAMPGGKIAFYSGIIDKLALTDEEIAAIMGHEIAHALREHSRERASEQVVSSLAITGAALVGSVLTDTDLTGASEATRFVYQTTFGLRHSREHETEADRIGVELAARAGYDPRAAILAPAAREGAASFVGIEGVFGALSRDADFVAGVGAHLAALRRQLDFVDRYRRALFEIDCARGDCVVL